MLSWLTLVCGSQAVAGAIANPHDLFSQKYLLARTEMVVSNLQCLECHISPTDSRPLIWSVMPDSIKTYGSIGNQCYSCHDGVSIVDRNVDAGLTVFHPASHGLDPAQAPVDTDLTRTGLPGSPASQMTCLNCHDPHLQKYRPFLRVPLTGVCERCHKERTHEDFGVNNANGTHPVGIEPFDETGGPSPIEVDGDFSVPFPAPYPTDSAYFSSEGHWVLGGHLTFGTYGRIECSTCHAFHGVENEGPFPDLLSKDPVNIVANEFCEGCHQGERGDDKEEPPYPNPGGTTTGRTYHPVDDDEANEAGWIVAVADTVDREIYDWGEEDPDTDLPHILCTTCHRAHNGMEYSPALVEVDEDIEAQGVTTFCEICHRDPPEGHHGYEDGGFITPEIAEQILLNGDRFGVTYGEPSPDRIYCSHCHRAHNAGYNKEEIYYIPILVEKRAGELCGLCHTLGVSHFMGDPTLPSTYEKADPPLKRDPWPWGGVSFYEGGATGTEDVENQEADASTGGLPNTVTCLSCHDLSTPHDGEEVRPYRLLAPAGEEIEWMDGYPEDYLCTGCHGGVPATIGQGSTHPLMEADASVYADIKASHLLSGEHPVSYTENGAVNCHSCHVAHNAVIPGGVYILKIGRGSNTDPKAIRPQLEYSDLCDSCHPYM